MAKTKQEIRNWLDAQVGKSLDEKCGEYKGQCVSLIKALFNFLGVENPYKARGNAKDAGDTYLREGICENKDGWLRVCINRNMGGGYGHIWIDLNGEANFEQNGAKALHTTKNTRPIQQAQQIISLDKFVGLAEIDFEAVAEEVIKGLWGNGDERKEKLGENYERVQNFVNAKLNAGQNNPTVNLEDLANRAIRGEFGNGQERKNRLGANYDAVQKLVNEKLGGK